MILNWLICPEYTNIYSIEYSLLIIIIILTLIRYILIFIGWSSNSNYSIIGAIRGITQILSYEIRFIIIILILILICERYRIIDIYKWQKYLWFIISLWPLFIIFFLRVLAELNRRPIDFVEGESELVSGFNIEYFRGRFALIFISEYGIIIFFRYLIFLLFTRLAYRIFRFFYIGRGVYIIIIIRGVLPRMRYDELINLCWKIILPFILSYLLIILCFKFIIIITLNYEKINRKLKISLLYFQNIFFIKIIN